MMYQTAQQFAQFCDDYFGEITLIFTIIASILIALILVTAKNWLNSYLKKSMLDNQYRRAIK